MSKGDDRAAFEKACHAAITRALDEAGIRLKVLRGMCIEVGLDAGAEAWQARGKQELLTEEQRKIVEDIRERAARHGMQPGRKYGMTMELLAWGCCQSLLKIIDEREVSR